MISVIIPTYNNHGILYAHLDKYSSQSCKEFEIIVVNDGGEPVEYDSPLVTVYNLEDNNGPASARNYGVRQAKYDRVLFVGDDCFPQRDLVLRHAIHHLQHPRIALQGYTPFHPDIMDTRFMQWLDQSGMQAAWQNLRDGDRWRKESIGFLLTTNFSMNKDDFLNFGGFPEQFPTAAWEDVAFGHELRRQGYMTYFDPTAINLHYHKHTMESFMQRQIKEGRSRIKLSALFPEFANSLISPNDLRGSQTVVIEEHAAVMKKLQFIEQANIQEEMSRLMLACSYRGVRETIEKEPILRALYHVHDAEYPAYIVSGYKAVQTGDTGFVQHVIQWALQKESSNWATHGFVGELHLAIGNKTEALFSFKKALEMNPGENWIKNRYKELVGKQNDR